jgi:hypothetical protein
MMHRLVSIMMLGAIVSGSECRAETSVDETAMIQGAIDRAVSHHLPRVRIEPGRHLISSALKIRKAEGLELSGSGAILVIRAPVSTILAEDSDRITLRDLTIDYDPTPSFQAVVREVSDGGRSMTIESGVAYQGRVEGLMGTDPSGVRPQGEDLYMGKNPASANPASQPGLLNLSGIRPNHFHPGDRLIVRPVIYGRPAVRFDNCHRISLDHISIPSSPGMACVFSGCEKIDLDGVRVAERAGGCLSSNADATHFNSCRGQIIIRNCIFEGMGDDAINVHGTYGRVAAVEGEKSLRIVTGRKDVLWQAPKPLVGDLISIHDPEHPFGKPVFEGKVAGVKVDSATRSASIIFDHALPPGLKGNSVAWNRSTAPTLTVTGCNFLNNRARGILVQTGNALIANNWFEGMSGAAIKVTCDVGRWWESGPSDHVTIRNNAISRCNDGAGRAEAALTVNADAPGLPIQHDVHRNLRIESNRIDHVTGSAISISSASGVTIARNRISWVDAPPIRISDSSNVTIEENGIHHVKENAN